MVIISSIKDKALKYLKSLRARIFIIMLFIGLFPVFLMKTIFLENYVTQAVNQKTALIQNQCQQIVSQAGSTGYIRDVSSAPQVDEQVTQFASIYSGRVIIVNSNFWIVRDTYEIDEGKAIISEEVLQCFQTATPATSYNEQEQFMELTLPIKNSGTGDTEGIMIVSVSTEDVNAGKDALEGTVLILQIVLTVFILVVAYYMARILTKPFGRITQSLEEVRDGVFEQ